MKKDERRQNKRRRPLKALISVIVLSMALSPVNVFATENESNTDNEQKHYFRCAHGSKQLNYYAGTEHIIWHAGKS